LSILIYVCSVQKQKNQQTVFRFVGLDERTAAGVSQFHGCALIKNIYGICVPGAGFVSGRTAGGTGFTVGAATTGAGATLFFLKTK
jgi:hypothetical protein